MPRYEELDLDFASILPEFQMSGGRPAGVGAAVEAPQRM